MSDDKQTRLKRAEAHYTELLKITEGKIDKEMLFELAYYVARMELHATRQVNVLTWNALYELSTCPLAADELRSMAKEKIEFLKDKMNIK